MILSAMIETIRTNSGNPDFIDLVHNLDAELAEIDGSEHAFYAQFNKVDTIKYVIVAYENNIPLACGAIKEITPDTIEVKRMYTIPQGRGKGFATTVISELEKWAAEMAYNRCVLETGIRQPDAVALYQKNGYYPIPNYGQYAGIENSLCFEKKIATGQ